MVSAVGSKRRMDGRHTLSAGIVIVRRGASPRYLLLRVFAYWDFPKGTVEPGETPFEAARREVGEETGITDLRFSWGPIWHETPPYGQRKVARYYIAESAGGAVHLGVNPQLGRPEHHEYRWLPYAAAARLLVPRLVTVLDWAHDIVMGRP